MIAVLAAHSCTGWPIKNRTFCYQLFIKKEAMFTQSDILCIMKCKAIICPVYSLSTAYCIYVVLLSAQCGKPNGIEAWSLGLLFLQCFDAVGWVF